MTTKVINTYIAAGYALASKYDGLTITSAGSVGGFGLFTYAPTNINNAGIIFSNVPSHAGVQTFALSSLVNTGYIGGNAGVYMHDGGEVTNAGSIDGTRDGVIVLGAAVVSNSSAGLIKGGRNGVVAYGDSAVSNSGSIEGGSTLYAGVQIDTGTIINGTVLYTAALISGYNGIIATGAASVTNYGVIHGSDFGVYLEDGGVLTNGTAIDHGAMVESLRGVEIKAAPGTVTNLGTLQCLSGAYASIRLEGGGKVTNGGFSDKTALISGGGGLYLGASGTVVNYGSIEGATEIGVSLHGGGTVINGDFGDTSAIVEGFTGVRADAAAYVTNLGTIDGFSGDGVRLQAGGTVTNGGAGDRGALIIGDYGVYGTGAAATVRNFGTIEGTRGLAGVHLFAGGAVANGSLNNAKATIEGYYGLIVSGTATTTNFGTISGQGDAGGDGVSLGAGATLTNGAAGHENALIEGFTGVYVYAGGTTVTNFGTISGAAGTAVRFVQSGDELIVEAGCAFQGAVLGGGGTLDLDSGTGTLTGLLSPGGNVTVSGSMATTTFQNFHTVEIGAAATFASSGSVTITAGQSALDAGMLTLGAKAGVTNGGTIETTGGTLTVMGAVAGGGVAIIDGGAMDFVSTFSQNVTFGGTTGVLELAKSQTYAGAITGFSKTGGTSLDLVDIAFVGAGEATYSGTRTSGVLTVTDGTHTAHINLKGNYLSSTFVSASDGQGGVIIHDPSRASPAASAAHAFIAAMASLAGDRAFAEASLPGGSATSPGMGGWQALRLIEPGSRLGNEA